MLPSTSKKDTEPYVAFTLIGHLIIVRAIIQWSTWHATAFWRLEMVRRLSSPSHFFRQNQQSSLKPEKRKMEKYWAEKACTKSQPQKRKDGRRDGEKTCPWRDESLKHDWRKEKKERRGEKDTGSGDEERSGLWIAHVSPGSWMWYSAPKPHYPFQGHLYLCLLDWGHGKVTVGEENSEK